MHLTKLDAFPETQCTCQPFSIRDMVNTRTEDSRVHRRFPGAPKIPGCTENLKVHRRFHCVRGRHRVMPGAKCSMPQMGMHYALHSLNGGALSAKCREWRCTDRQHRPPCAKRAPSQELRRATCKPSSVRTEQRASRVAHMSSGVQVERRASRVVIVGCEASPSN